MFFWGFWHQGALRISSLRRKSSITLICKNWLPDPTFNSFPWVSLCVFLFIWIRGLGNKASISFDEMDRFDLSRRNFDVPRKPAGFFPKDRGGDAKEVQSQLNETLPILLPLKKSKSHQGIASGCRLGTPSLSHLAKGYIYIGVSKNSGIPKWMVYNGKTY